MNCFLKLSSCKHNKYWSAFFPLNLVQTVVCKMIKKEILYIMLLFTKRCSFCVTINNTAHLIYVNLLQSYFLAKKYVKQKIH